MGYKAVNIARRMIQLSIENRLWITNLQLQKILYFTWIDYYRDTGTRLFDDQPFEAWKYGPVISKVYLEYKSNMARPIFLTKEPDEDMSAVSEHLLRSLEKYRAVPTGKLVDMAHAEGSPWERCYREDRMERIPFSMIERSVLASSEN